jgi:holin-like protein
LIQALTALLGFQLAGELIVCLTGIPVPGPVLGMVLLAAFFA